MNICFVNHTAIPANHKGPSRHHALARYLQQHGHNAQIIAANYCHFNHQRINKNYGIDQCSDDHDGVPFIWVNAEPAYSGNNIKRLFNMLSFGYNSLRKKNIPQKKPDILVGSSPNLFAAFAAYRLAKRYAIPFIFEVRDIWPKTLTADRKISSYHPVILTMALIERLLYRKADAIAYTMPNFPAYLQHIGLEQYTKKCTYLPNFLQYPLDIKKIGTDTTTKPSDKFTIMYAGSHGYANGLDIVLQAAKLLQAQAVPIEIQLVGTGPEKATLQRMAKQEVLTNIVFFDAITKSEIPKTLARADAYLLPLRDNPIFEWGVSPAKAFDYMAMAKPVIAAINTTQQPIAMANAGISLDTLDAKTLAEACIKLYQMPTEQRQALGNNGLDYLQKHSLEVVGERLLQLATTLHKQH